MFENDSVEMKIFVIVWSFLLMVIIIIIIKFSIKLRNMIVLNKMIMKIF